MSPQLKAVHSIDKYLVKIVCLVYTSENKQVLPKWPSSNDTAVFVDFLSCLNTETTFLHVHDKPVTQEAKTSAHSLRRHTNMPQDPFIQLVNTYSPDTEPLENSGPIHKDQRPTANDIMSASRCGDPRFDYLGSSIPDICHD
jgi:hypothetical protein